MVVERLPLYTQQLKQRVWILLALYHQSQESYIHVNLRILHLKCLLLMVLFLDILLFTRSKPGEERPGGSCSWILVTLNAEKLHQQPQQEVDDGVMWRRSHELS
ncbi:hypothetical protein Bca4012_029625 [Brassica carinata]